MPDFSRLVIVVALALYRLTVQQVSEKTDSPTVVVVNGHCPPSEHDCSNLVS